MNKFIYLDHAATTPLRDDVLKRMLPFFKENYGNASAVYELGKISRTAIESARKSVATTLNCDPSEIFFTSGGSESDNWAIGGIAQANKYDGKHIITSRIEHKAVLETCMNLEKEGYKITYLPVNEFGQVSPEQVANEIRPDTILISIMYANNEIGTIEPIAEIAQIAHERSVYFHTDAVQAVGSVPIDVRELGIDLLSLSAHKFYGPKGVGVLYVKKPGVKINPLILGGAQEYKQRAGTENVAGIVGLGVALDLYQKEGTNNTARIITMRDYFIQNVLKEIPDSFLNGHPTNRLPGNANISFSGINAKYLAAHLAKQNVFVSNGSACNCKESPGSYVLSTVNKRKEDEFTAIRFSFGKDNTYEEIEYVLELLKCEISRIRNI